MPHAPGRLTLWVESTIHLDEDYSPEPDLVLLNFRDDDYKEGDPTVDDGLLIIESASPTWPTTGTPNPTTTPRPACRKPGWWT